MVPGMKGADPKPRGELRAAGTRLGRKEDAGKPRAGHLLHAGCIPGDRVVAGPALNGQQRRRANDQSLARTGWQWGGESDAIKNDFLEEGVWHFSQTMSLP